MRQGVRDCIIMSELVIGSIIVLFFVAGQPILQLFLGSSSNGTVISVGIEYLLIVAPFYPLVGIKNCCDSALRGGGAMGPFMITTLADLALRVALAYIMVPMMGFAGVCYAYPLGWVIGILYLYHFLYLQRLGAEIHARCSKRPAFICQRFTVRPVASRSSTPLHRAHGTDISSTSAQTNLVFSYF